ncbi:MAG: Rid family detoxifying hydrolase [Fibrobacterota bacterium]
MALKSVIRTDKAPAAIGPYSQGIISDGLIFLSGQIPLRPDGTQETGDIRAQARQCLTNMRALLQSAGADMADLLKVTVFVTDLGTFTAVNEVYTEFFSGIVPPARSFIQVAALPKGAGVEIEGIARKPA